MKTLLIFALLTGPFAFALTDQEESNDLALVSENIKLIQIFDGYSAEDILVVFDIDNTLLANQDYLGSDQWFTWKAQQIKDNGSDLFPDLLKWQEIIYNGGKTRATQKNVAAIVAKIQAENIDTIALTSRSPHYREATERALENMSIDMSLKQIGSGIPYIFIPEGHKREASYMNGIFMTSGQHKGEMLKFLLSHFGSKYRQIIFVDDHLKHTTRVFESYQNSNTDILTIRYGKEDQRVKEFHESDAHKAVTTKKLKLLYETLLKVFGSAPRLI